MIKKYVYGSVCLCTMVMPPDLRGEKGAVDALELESQRVLGMETQLSGRTASALNYWVIYISSSIYKHFIYLN